MSESPDPTNEPRIEPDDTQYVKPAEQNPVEPPQEGATTVIVSPFPETVPVTPGAIADKSVEVVEGKQKPGERQYTLSELARMAAQADHIEDTQPPKE